MLRYAGGVAALVAIGVAIAVAFGADALWVYAFFALLAAGTALAIGLGGNVVTEWSRRWFERRDRERRI